MKDKDAAKRAAAYAAVELVQSGMLLGIGTGSTTAFFIEALLQRIQKDALQLRAICTSKRSEALLKGSIPLMDEELDYNVDMTFDGADCINKEGYRIKGGGGALLREKLVSLNTEKNIVLIDESKVSLDLSSFPLPIEIVPFGRKSTIERLYKIDYTGTLRMQGTEPYVTDNQNNIYDLKAQKYPNPLDAHKALKALSGVVETGLFVDKVSEVFIGNAQGEVTRWTNP